MPMHEKVAALEILELKIVRLVDALVGEKRLSFRIECFGPASASGAYRVLVWRLEYFRLQSTFPQKAGLPAHPPSDHEIMVRDDEMIAIDDEIKASSAAEAVEHVVRAIRSLVSEA